MGTGEKGKEGTQGEPHPGEEMRERVELRHKKGAKIEPGSEGSKIITSEGESE